MNDRSVLLRRAVAGALVLASLPALSQQTTQTDENTRTIDTIIVTAQKREQSLQDVPIVVTAVSEQLLRDTGVKDIKDLAILAPGLTVTSTSSEASTTARIRGIGTVGDNPGLESSVGVVIDGVYRPRNGVAFGDLGELERIEVLKGPQGTLFGKNTSAGVINVISKRPQFDFGSDIELTTGNFGAMEGAASITGPIAGETVAGRLYVAARERDGYYDVNRGEGPRTLDEDWNRDFYTARGQLLLHGSSRITRNVMKPAVAPCR
jgi:iron complex outermembrane recepter protein